MKNRLIVFFTLSLLFLSLFNQNLSYADNWDPKKMTQSETELYVLGQTSRMVSTYNTKLQKTSQFEIMTPLSSSLPMPTDICYDNGFIYVAEKTMRKILIYTKKGEFVRYLGGCGELLRAPSAIFVKNSILYIGDLGCLYVCSDSGNLINRITLPINATGGLSIISDICEENNSILIANQTNGTIEAPGKDEAYGGFGTEVGRFQKISGICSNGNLLVADPFLGKIEMRHPSFDHFVPVPSGEKNKHPTDVTWFNNQFLSVDAINSEITKLDLGFTQTKDQVLLSTNSLDMGTLSRYRSEKLSFKLFSKSGYPVSGETIVDNPLFEVKPTVWSGTSIGFSVQLNEKLIKDGAMERGLITLKLSSGEKVTVSIKVQFGMSQDFFLAFTGGNQITFQDNQINFYLAPENGFKGKIECSSKTPDLPFLVEWYPPSFEIDSDDPYKIQITLKPINKENRKPKPGFYSIPYQIKAVTQKIIKQGTFTFLYKGIENTVSGSVLGELFTTDWCPFCPSAHRAMPELEKKYGEQFPMVTYYIDCSDASPQRLCFPEGIDRKLWYLPQGTPTLILNGTTIKNGGYKSPTETMTKDYSELIDELLPNASPLSLTSSARFDRESRLLTIGTKFTWLQKPKLVDPRLYVVICENKLEYVAKNKETIHDYVARQFLSLPNPENNPSFGTQMIEDSPIIQIEGMIDPVIHQDNMYCVIFVQDNTTKQVIHSRIIPINQLLCSDFSIESIQSDLIYKKSKVFSARYTLTNEGNQIESFSVRIPENQLLPPGSLLVAGGNEFSTNQTVSVTLCPNETSRIEVRSTTPPDDTALQSLSILATNQSESVSKSAKMLIRYVPDDHPRYEVIYPREEKDKSNVRMMLIRTEPGTTTNHQTWVVGNDGILAVPIPSCPGENLVEFDLIYPDKTKEHVTKTYRSSLLMTLTIGSTQVKVNEQLQSIEAPPYIKNGRTMVPIRLIAEAFCSTVEFDPATRGIRIHTKDKVINLQIGSSYAMVNGKTAKLDAPPEINNGRTFLPLRFIVEMFGASIDWNAKLGEIQIKM
jgi:thiol-disulfide isomerase/thioredoxin